MKVPKISDRVAAVLGYGFLIATAPITIPAAAIIGLGVGVALAKRWAIGPHKEWGQWFAWHPVRLGEWFDTDWRWLEMVERRSWSLLADTEYRAVRPVTEVMQAGTKTTRAQAMAMAKKWVLFFRKGGTL